MKKVGVIYDCIRMMVPKETTVNERGKDGHRPLLHTLHLRMLIHSVNQQMAIYDHALQTISITFNTDIHSCKSEPVLDTKHKHFTSLISQYWS